MTKDYRDRVSAWMSKHGISVRRLVPGVWKAEKFTLTGESPCDSGKTKLQALANLAAVLKIKAPPQPPVPGAWKKLGVNSKAVRQTLESMRANEIVRLRAWEVAFAMWKLKFNVFTRPAASPNDIAMAQQFVFFPDPPKKEYGMTEYGAAFCLATSYGISPPPEPPRTLK